MPPDRAGQEDEDERREGSQNECATATAAN